MVGVVAWARLCGSGRARSRSGRQVPTLRWKYADPVLADGEAPERQIGCRRCR